MRRIKVAVVRHNGLFMGGTEKFLQIMAANVDKRKFEVDYYTTNLMRYKDREKYLRDNRVNVIKFHKFTDNEKYRVDTSASRWNHIDFWRKFEKKEYDMVQITNFSWGEHPYNAFDDENVCEFAVFAPYCRFPGVKKSILNSEWLRDRWVETGGSRDKSVVIPVPVWKPLSFGNMRKQLGISSDTFVCGFHQRNNDDIFSDVQLEAYKEIETDKTCMIVGNGSRLYREQAEDLEIKNIRFLGYLNSEYEMSKFFNTLNLYTHGRKDGETYGTVFAEAMIHGIPCISHWTDICNAMEETIGGGGIVINRDPLKYAETIQRFIDDNEMRKYYSDCAFKEANKRFTYDKVIPKIEEVWTEVASSNW